VKLSTIKAVIEDCLLLLFAGLGGILLSVGLRHRSGLRAAPARSDVVRATVLSPTAEGRGGLDCRQIRVRVCGTLTLNSDRLHLPIVATIQFTHTPDHVRPPTRNGAYQW
jgi:hypothetical protein